MPIMPTRIAGRRGKRSGPDAEPAGHFLNNMTPLYCSLPVLPRREDMDDDIVFVGRYETWYRSASGYRYIVRESNR